MQVNINTIQTTMNIQECMMVHELQLATSQNTHLQQLIEQIMRGWPETKDHLAQNVRSDWVF